jgi:hypothetical protein
MVSLPERRDCHREADTGIHVRAMRAVSGKMPSASSDTGFAQRRAGGYGRLYDETDDLADEAHHENQEKEEAVKYSLKMTLPG